MEQINSPQYKIIVNLFQRFINLSQYINFTCKIYNFDNNNSVFNLHQNCHIWYEGGRVWKYILKGL